MGLPQQKLTRPTITLENNYLILRCSFFEREIAKSIAGYQWDPKRKAWKYAVRPETYSALKIAFPTANTSPAVLEALERIIIREKQVAQAKTIGWEKAEPIEPMPIKTKPFNHQILGFNIGLQLPAAALLMEQGCGKTLTAIAIAGRRFLRGEIKRLLIIAPASVVPVWPKEFEAHADFFFDVHALQGAVTKREETLLSWPPNPERLQVAVTNYEAAWRMIDALAPWRPDMIICDESQRIKTPSARQSKAMHQLGGRAKYRLILTGTPVTQGPLDVFSQYKFLDPAIFGNSYYAFRNQYAIMGGYGGYQVIGYKNMPELIKKAHSIAFRVTKAEALDLPEFVDQVRYCELEPKASKIYWQLAKQSIAELSEEKVITATNVLSRLLRLSQVAGGFINDGGACQQVSTAKMELLNEVLGDLLDTGKKVVVFARFLPELAAIEDLLVKKDVEYARIAGDVDMASRGEEVKRFQEDPECKVFLAQIQTAGLGITLTAADTAIFYSLDYSFANYDQCRARIHRIGQKNACTYIHLVAQGTVDEKVLATLQAKKSVADEVVDSWKNLFEPEKPKYDDPYYWDIC